mgnify:CR=1 FL=1
MWSGLQPGIYTSWDDCRKQVHGIQGAQYKSYDTKKEAQAAFEAAPPTYKKQSAGRLHKDLPPNPPAARHDTVLPLPPEVRARALAVDASCSGNPGAMEYRGVCLTTGREVFHYGPVYGTNNIGEFLAIVHGLALIQQQGLTDMTLYSDSRNALLWTRKKKCKTTLARTARTEALFGLIDRAEQWLKNNKWDTSLIKWDTERWGEIPADFGRK